MATASSTCFRPIAFSTTPGIGKVRVTAPAVTTTTSYGTSKSAPISGCTEIDLCSWSIRVAAPAMILRVPQMAAQGDADVARLDRAADHLGKERLVGHVRKRLDDGQLRLASTQPLLELPGRVEAGVPAADD